MLLVLTISCEFLNGEDDLQVKTITIEYIQKVATDVPERVVFHIGGWARGKQRLNARNNSVIYMQSNKIHNVVLMSKFYSALFVSSTCFGPHRSIIRSVLYKLYS